MWRNRTRERKWNAMSPAEREAYLNSFAGNEDGNQGGAKVSVNGARGGNKRLDFRFVH